MTFYETIPRGLTVPTYDLEDEVCMHITISFNSRSLSLSYLRSRCSRADKIAENPLKTAFPEFLFIRLLRYYYLRSRCSLRYWGLSGSQASCNGSARRWILFNTFTELWEPSWSGPGDQPGVIPHMLSRNCINRIETCVPYFIATPQAMDNLLYGEVLRLAFTRLLMFR